MNNEPPTLDNQVFTGRLRREYRASSYSRRPTPRPAKRFQDISNPPAANPPVRPENLSLINFKIVPALKRTAPAALPQQSQSPEIITANLGSSQPSRPRVLYAMAGIIFVAGLIVSLAGFRTNNAVQAQVNKLSSSVVPGVGNEDSPPSTNKPSASAVGSYTVNPDLPRYIDIPSLAVHARVLSAGTTKTGALAAPNNVYDAAWYKNSAKPGQPGAMLIDGHISGWTTKGVFYGLKKLKPGDRIVITRGDGSKFTYKVADSRLYDAAEVDMASLLVSIDTSKPGLNLISCSGDVIPGTSEFNKRIAVFSVAQ